MRRSLQLIICPALSIALHACALKPGTPTPQADLILTGGAIHTMDAQRSRAEAIAVRAGRIVYVGAAAEAETFRGPATRVVDLGNRMLLPSFQDVHIHPTLGGTAYSECPLFDAGNVDDILAVIRGCIDANSEAEYISATGWRWSQFVDAQPPHKSTLDQLDFTGPIITGDADGHTLWVNSAALELAQITGSTPDPEGSEIGRDADGSPRSGGGRVRSRQEGEEGQEGQEEQEEQGRRRSQGEAEPRAGARGRTRRAEGPQEGARSARP